jgi:uncharacterized alkaline shock family protein YloU
LADEKNVEIDMGENNSITEMDSIYVSTEVIRKIVGMTVNRVDGVSGMSAGLVGGIAERLGQRDLSKGIKVQQFDNQISIDINVIVEYGVKIPEVAEKLQDAVRQAVEETTGYQVTEVNLHVQGIQLPRPKEEEEEVKKADGKREEKKDKKDKKDKEGKEGKEGREGKEGKEGKEGEEGEEGREGKEGKEGKDKERKDDK